MHRGHICGLLLLPALLVQGATEWRTISGVVVDLSGKPVTGARIEHLGLNTGQITDARGHFEFVTTAPAVVIRKIGYQSRRLDPAIATEVRIVLEPAHSIASCTLSSVPKPRVTSSEDIDYLSTSYILPTADGPVAMVCGRGPSWSLGVPRDSLVWESVEYEESMTGDGAGDVDARGKSRDGTFWRYRGTLGDSCAYSKVDQATTAAAFDCILNPPKAK